MNSADRLVVDTSVPGQIVLAGEIDVATAPRLRQPLDAAPTDRPLTLDLAGVTFIDSSGLRVLIEHHQRYERAGSELHLVNVSSTVSRLLDISGLTGHLHVS